MEKVYLEVMRESPAILVNKVFFDLVVERNKEKFTGINFVIADVTDGFHTATLNSIIYRNSLNFEIEGNPSWEIEPDSFEFLAYCTLLDIGEFVYENQIYECNGIKARLCRIDNDVDVVVLSLIIETMEQLIGGPTYNAFKTGAVWSPSDSKDTVLL